MEWATDGKMNRKLLQKTTLIYIVYSLLAILISIPITYITINRLYIAEADELLNLHKEEFEKHNLPNLKIKDISIWNQFNRNSLIIKNVNTKKDTIFNSRYFDEREGDMEACRMLYVPIKIENKNYLFTDKINRIERNELLGNISMVYFLLSVVIFSGFVLLNIFLTKYLWKPFYNTLSKMKLFEIDKNQRPQFIETTTTEFKQLNKTLDNLIERNLNIYQTQMEFIENAAHELQTPLAIFQTKIDNLFQIKDLNTETITALETINQDLMRLKRLNKNLLLLSKIENEVYIDKEQIVVQDYILKNMTFFEEQAENKNIKINYKENIPIHLYTNPTLFEVLVNNLFLNAIRHNIEDGFITVEVNKNALLIINSGTREALNKANKFNRFSKKNPEVNSNGLGLAIVKKIVDFNGWQIDYEFKDGNHFFFVYFYSKT